MHRWDILPISCLTVCRHDVNLLLMNKFSSTRNMKTIIFLCRNEVVSSFPASSGKQLPTLMVYMWFELCFKKISQKTLPKIYRPISNQHQQPSQPHQQQTHQQSHIRFIFLFPGVDLMQFHAAHDQQQDQ